MKEIEEGVPITLKVPKQQADATLSQTNPVSGTKYTVLDTTKNVRVRSIAVKCTWSVQPTPLEIHITRDGQAIIHSIVNPVSNTWYECVIYSNYGELNQLLVAATSANRVIPLCEGRSVKVEAEITGGTVSDLSARMKYAKLS